MTTPVVVEDADCTDTAARGRRTIAFSLPTGDGGSLNLRMAWRAERLGLGDLVPPARVICDMVTARARLADTSKVLCREGCSACCHAMAPLSVPEIVCMQRELNIDSPSADKWLADSFAGALQRMIHAGPPEIAPADPSGLSAHTRAAQVALWCESMDYSCPFLRGSACAIYDRRPLACREQMAVDPHDTTLASRCPGKSTLRPSVSVLEALAATAAQVEGTAAEAVPIPLAIHWSNQNVRRARRDHNATTLLTTFANALEDIARIAKPSAA